MRLGEAKTIIFYFIKTRAGHDAADLGLFAKHQQIRENTRMQTAPVFAGDAHAALHFVKNQQYVVFIAQAAQQFKKFGTEMPVPAFALDGFNDNGGNVCRLLRQDVADLFFGELFFFDHVG